MEINQDFEIKKYPNEIRLEKNEKNIIGSNIFSILLSSKPS